MNNKCRNWVCFDKPCSDDCSQNPFTVNKKGASCLVQTASRAACSQLHLTFFHRLSVTAQKPQRAHLYVSVPPAAGWKATKVKRFDWNSGKQAGRRGRRRILMILDAVRCIFLLLLYFLSERVAERKISCKFREASESYVTRAPERFSVEEINEWAAMRICLLLSSQTCTGAISHANNPPQLKRSLHQLNNLCDAKGKRHTRASKERQRKCFNHINSHVCQSGLLVNS